jgi:D-sedoheptulose 7-phosphate isomerase
MICDDRYTLLTNSEPMRTTIHPASEAIRMAIDEHLQVVAALDALIPDIERVAAAMISCLRSGGKILWMGNGGSAADSQHLAAELVGRFRRERRGLASIALTVDSSILTAIGNDYGFDSVFERQVEALCRSGDVVVGITTSGNSPNILGAMRKARRLGAVTVGLTGGSGGALMAESDLCLVVPSGITARVQEAHILIGHVVCDRVEEALVGEEAGDVRHT